MKRAAIVLVGLLLVLILAGGGSSSAGERDRSIVESLGYDNTSGSSYYIDRIRMDNGKVLICLENYGYKRGGISCNWDQFNRDSGRTR